MSALPGGPPYPGGPDPGMAEVTTCTWHPDRATGLRCTRCGRPACPECLTPASVGFHCRHCVAEGQAAVPTPRTVSGSRLGQLPRVTAALIAINLLVFVIAAIQARSLADPSNSSVFQQGTLIPDLVGSGQLWRMVTSGFLQFNIPHIALNMLSLYLLGMPMERIIGRGRFLVVYLLGLLGGSVAVLLFSGSTAVTAGASGAIFGLLGGLFIIFRRMRLDPRQIVIVLVLNLVLTFSLSGISWQAHLGGLAVGTAAAAVMVYPPRERRRQLQNLGSFGLLALLVVITVGWMVLHHSDYCGITDGYFRPCRN